MTPTAGILAGLLQAIIADPDTDDRRLVLADAYEDAGLAARSELIRVQVELARLGPVRKCYTDLHSFSFGRGKGRVIVVSGKLPDLGERIDLVLPQAEQRRYRAKQNWIGLLVMEVKPYRFDTRQADVSFRVDAESRPWAGEPLLKRERELWERRSGHEWAQFPELESACLKHAVHLLIPQNTLSVSNKISRALVRRGWPAEARVTPEQWLGGGPCPQCIDPNDRDDPCPQCGGSGELPALGLLLADYPLERVELVGKKPRLIDSGFQWSRRLSDDCSESWYLPAPIFDALLPDTHARWVRDNYHIYESEADALAALSPGCIRQTRAAKGRKP